MRLQPLSYLGDAGGRVRLIRSRSRPMRGMDERPEPVQYPPEKNLFATPDPVLAWSHRLCYFHSGKYKRLNRSRMAAVRFHWLNLARDGNTGGCYTTRLVATGFCLRPAFKDPSRFWRIQPRLLMAIES